MIVDAFSLFFLLMFGHALADYPLQGDFLARAKNLTAPLPEVPWCLAMGAHAMIHAGLVAYLTGSIMLGVVEFVLHFTIDVTKCKGRITFGSDQLLHTLCKVAYVVLVVVANG